MISANVKIDFNSKGVMNRNAAKSRRVQFQLDQQVAKDSNYYCPEDVGSLQDSVLPSAAEGKGLLIWNEPYAQAQYRGLPNKSRDKNPNAQMKWFEWGKKFNLKKWVKVAQDGYNQRS